MSRRRRYLIAVRERLLHPATVSATTLHVAVKAGLAAGLSIWIAELIGLTDPYWALLPFIGLSLGARLGAATSLLVTIVPGSDILQTAFARGANVPLGCVIAIVTGALLWPVRAERQLEERLRADVGSSGELRAEVGAGSPRPPTSRYVYEPPGCSTPSTVSV